MNDRLPSPASFLLALFAAFLLAAGLAGPMSPPAARLLTAMALAGAVAWCWRVTPPVRWARLIAAAPLVPLLFGLLATDAGDALQAACVAAIAVMLAWQTRDSARAAVTMLAARAVCGAALLLVLTRHSSFVWRLFDTFAAALSAAAGALVREPIAFGPTPAGLWIGVLFLLLLLPGAMGISARRRIVFAAIVVATLLAYAMSVDLLERGAERLLAALLVVPEPHLPYTVGRGKLATILPLVPLLLLLAPAAWLLREARLPAREPLPLRPILAGAALLATGAFLLLAPAAPPARARGVIAFHDGTTLDWNTPARGRYGLINVGMFGMLRSYLDAAGYKTRPIGGTLDARALAGVTTLTIVNPQRALTAAERAAVWQFVERGGGLLVAGDHTDIFGTMRPLNELLVPLGVRFEFDSAFALRKHWRHCEVYLPHALTRGVFDHRDTQTGTGASLTLTSAAARPVIVGRYAFGDYGNRANGGQGAFLGDYGYQLGERLGDVVLAAAADVGRGRVVVLGDTTAFQPLALPHAYPFVERTFRWLAAPAPSSLVLRLLGAVAALAGLAFLFTARRAGGVLLIAALAVVVADGALSLRPAPPAAPLPPGRVAIIDTTHAELLPLETFEENSQGGIGPALMRAGRLPLIPRRTGAATFDTAATAVFVSPLRAPGRATSDAITRMLHRGGTLVVSGGGTRRDVANQLLAPCGVRIGDYPLGPASIVRRDGEEVRFVDAWPVQARRKGTLRALARTGEDVLVGEASAGRGRCIAIGDARFFEDTNFEGEYEAKRGAVELADAFLAGASR